MIVVIAVTGHLVLTRTRLGRYAYAMGSNAEAARLSGIPVRRHLTGVYVISGALAGLGGMIAASRINSGQPNFGIGLELDVIAAVVIGGASLFGGQGTVLGSLIGALLVALIRNGAVLLDINTFYQNVIIGVIIWIAVFWDRFRRRRLGPASSKEWSMRKVIAAADVAAVALTACSADVRESDGGGGPDSGQGGGPIELAVVPKAIGFDFWESVRHGAECAASKLEGVDVHWDGVIQETDVSGQGTQPQPAQVPVYATDNVAAAERATRHLADELGGQGKVAFIAFQPGTATNDTRTEGFMNVLRANPGLQLVAQQSSDSDYNQALQVTQDILTANPDLDGIYAANEPSVLGAAEAVRQAGRAGQVTIVGWDTAPGEILGVRDGVISAVVAQNPFRMGYEGVNAAVNTIRDGQPAPGGDTGAMLITRDNVDDPEVTALLRPSCENPPRVGP